MKKGIESGRESVGVVIPALNEAGTLAEIILNVKPHASSILVVDGNSEDDTASIARALGVEVVADHGKGKGEAIRTAIAHLKEEITVFIDADGSHDPRDIPKLIQPILEGQADHVSGSRLIGGSSELHGGFDECFRLAGSSFITTLINKRFNVRLSESQNGFRAIRTDVLRNLDLQEDITTIEQEMIIKTLKKGYRMAEVPAHEYCRKAGCSKIRLGSVAFRYVYSVIKYLYLN
ncbi:dolichol-phosphate mannosyltransferase [Syntrophus gentianae]|uniref:Dolichol-phosphate mannosyltransferase n=1 Tax=Syntrophus gentianae TaxID=43775 RepID=A0A1H7Z3F8_9BACT|nr:glycosyltransferase family 2 protein [Syntrophus gentianae]SEM53132.1 dolichol-phosphate mannosyltransferase [Syntrophus gentianae]